MYLLGVRAALRARQARQHGSLSTSTRHRAYRDMWAGAARAVGAELTDLGRGFCELRRSGYVTLVHGQLTCLDDPVAMRLADDKYLARRQFTEAGISVPDSVRCELGDLTAAAELLTEFGVCVVKPAAGTAGGDGVTGGVRTWGELCRAALRAGRFGDELLVERQVGGLLHRLLLLDGELLDVVVDRPAHVTGDGESTVARLIDLENDRRVVLDGRGGLELIDVNLDVILALQVADLSLSSVPPAGQCVRVRTVTNDRGPLDSRTYRDAVHSDVLGQARSAAASVGLRLAGVDVVASRIDQPLTTTGGALLEVNAAPGVLRHYLVAEPRMATRVAEPILQRLLSERSR